MWGPGMWLRSVGCACGDVCVRWSMDARGPDRCVVVYVMCVEQEEACESLELLQMLPAVMLELMKLMV